MVGVRVRQGLPPHRRRARTSPRPSARCRSSTDAAARTCRTTRPRWASRRRASTCTSLRDGVKTVLKHPWGFGLGNSGVTAARTHVAIKAGESTYTELGVETGLLGGLVFVAWSLVALCAARSAHAVARRRVRRGARARAADRRDRRAVARGRGVGARRRSVRTRGARAVPNCAGRNGHLRHGAVPYVLTEACSLSSRSASFAVALVVAALPSALPRRRRRGGAGRAREPDAHAGRAQPATSRRRRSAPTICVHGWTRTIRPPSSYTSQLKVEQVAQYGLAARRRRTRRTTSSASSSAATRPTRATSGRSRTRAPPVDQIENELNRRVCSGAHARRRAAPRGRRSSTPTVERLRVGRRVTNHSPRAISLVRRRWRWDET